MTDKPNLDFKKIKEINIDGKDVKRILILNDVVWEKIRPVEVTLSSSSPSVTIGKTFNLIATVTSENKSVNGTIKFSGNGINGEKEIEVVDGIATLQKISPTTEGNQTYKATFQKSENFLEQEATTTVNVSKEKSILTVYGEKVVYDTWKIGAKLTGNDGKTPLTNRNITINFLSQSHTIKTNSKGIASYKVDISEIGASDDRTVSYVFNGDSQYKNSSVIAHYKIIAYKETKPGYAAVNLGSQNESTNTQKWIQNSTTFQCYKSGVACYGTDTIASASGTHKIPSELVIAFNQNTITYIKEANLTFYAQSLANACNGSTIGGLFASAPTVTLETTTTKVKGTGAKAFPSKSSGGYSYSSHDVLAQSITWGARKVSRNPIIVIKYPANSGVEEACLRLTKVTLTLKYIPTQNTTF